MEDKDKLKTKTKTNQGKDKDKDNLHGIGKLKPGGGSCWEILNYILIKKTVLVVGEDLVYFSD